MQESTNSFDAYNWLKSLPKELVEQISEKNRINSETEYKKFTDMFDKGFCYICSSPLMSFNTDSPCLHWFLIPTNIKKHHIKNSIGYLGKKYGFYKTNTYLRWVANYHSPFKNINDFESTDASKIIEETIVFKNIKWSFSCSVSDFTVHTDSNVGTNPHYHMEMRYDNLPFFRFNDFHIPLTEEDIWKTNLSKSGKDDIVLYNQKAWGMKDFCKWGANPENANQILKLAGSTENAELEDLEINTFITSLEGQTFSGEDIYQAIEKSKKENTSISYQLQESNTLSETIIQTIITPGKAVPEIMTRNKRK